MILRTIRIQNYKCFADSGVVELSPGFNVIIGRNNAGKTALVEALTLASNDKRHRSAKTIPYVGFGPRHPSTVEATVELSTEEIIRAIEATGQVRLSVPDKSQASAAPDRFIKIVNSTGDKIVTIKRVGADIQMVSLDGFGELTGTPSMHFGTSRANGQLEIDSGVGGPISGGPVHDLFGYHLAQYCGRRLYAFRAERLHVAHHPIGDGRELQPDARNLAQVLDGLQNANPTRWEELNKSTRTVFPEIHQITVPVRSNEAHIHIWFHEAKTAREDLAISLDESGTGVGQVLAMLYVVLTADEPKVILIDEPQSFLHPGAIRKLLEIFEQHAQHQYIITTHSPVALSSLSLGCLIEVVWQGSSSKLQSVNPEDARALRTMLAGLGVRTSDVFGADRVLWVEGPTEETCYPMIVKGILKRPLQGTVILGVVDVGGLTAGDTDRALRIYERLSSSGSFLPPALAFLFDREGRTDQEVTLIEKRANGRVSCLARRTYENYLLNSRAISAVVNGIDGFRDEEVKHQEIETWLKRAHRVKKYTKANSGEQLEGEWIVIADGARVLSDLFSELSETRVAYDKVRHGQALTEWLVDHSPGDLSDIAGLLNDRLQKVGDG